jgi:RES domain-containing protein
MLKTIEGEFVKIAFALRRQDPNRPAARFNRRGQDALYLSPNADAACVAIGEYVKPCDPPRVLLRYHVSKCEVVDLQALQNKDLYSRAGHPWQADFKAGKTPLSWEAADEIRSQNIAGLIDPSRRRIGLWHITLFTWNSPNAPTVTAIGEPTPIQPTPNYR